MSELLKEYDRFMKWFNAEHPALHDKYARNVSIPFMEGGRVSVNNYFNISQAEFDILTHVASSFYDNKAADLFDTIEYKYGPGITRNESGEAAMRQNAQMWLAPVIKRINRERGKVIISFIKPAVYTIYVDGVSVDLKIRAKRLVASYNIRFRA
jgi:hypothetical protein